MPHSRHVPSPIVLEQIATDDYVREILPLTYPLWGSGRTFETYVADLRTMASSAYGRRGRFTVGLREGDAIACSCKNYDRDVIIGERALRATGYGAVYTAEPFRGRGFASAMIGASLDAERAAGRDLAYLYSDIDPAFYANLGFIALPSRLLTLRAASLDGAPAGAEPLRPADWPAVRRCFDAMEATRPFVMRRTPALWETIRHIWDAPAPAGTQPVQLVVRRERKVAAYAIGRRVMREDTFVCDEFGFDGDEGRARIPALLRAAAGDLGRIGGWLPPLGVRDVLPRGSVRRRKDAVLMIAPLSTAARTWWASEGEAILTSRADATWSADHL